MMKRKGFTLFELLLVVGILLVMTGLSAAFYSRFLVQNAVDNTHQQIVESLRKAQMYSMSGKADSNWGVRYASGVITLYAVSGGRDETFSVNPNVTVTGLSGVVFARVTGKPAGSTTISVTGNNTTKTINVNTMGVVSR